VKKLEPEQQEQVEVAGDEEREERVFNPAGYEAHLVETIEKDILQRNPDVTWAKVAGLHEAKAILQEAMVLPILMPDFFKVLCRSGCFLITHLASQSDLIWSLEQSCILPN
jgi:katanin p60 ATPase-containing subunit A1